MGRLGPHVVGLRVVVRRVLPGETGPTGGPAMTDVLGICESWEDGIVTVRREDGSVVEIATADIVSGKPVPPRPSVHRRLDAATGRPAGAAGLAAGRERAARCSGCSAPPAVSRPGATRCSPSGTRGCPAAEAVARVTRVVRRPLPACPRPRPPGPARGGGVRGGRLVDLRADAAAARVGGQGAAEPRSAAGRRATARRGRRRRLAGQRRAGGAVRRARPRGPRGRRGHLRHRQGRAGCGAGARSRRVPRRLGRCLRAVDGPGPPGHRPGQRRAGVTALVGGRARCDHVVPPGGRVQRPRAPDLRGARVRGAPPLRLPRRRGGQLRPESSPRAEPWGRSRTACRTSPRR